MRLDKEPIIEYLNSNITLLKWMIAEGYGDARTLERRIKAIDDADDRDLLTKRYLEFKSWDTIAAEMGM